MDSEPRTRLRGISAKTLTTCDYAVCFFPEQPKQQAVVEQDRGVEEQIRKVATKNVEAFMDSSPKTERIRLYWRNRLVYLIAFISYSLSLNNIYHFPLNVHRYGFEYLFPYTIVTIFVGYPLHTLEASLGQYSQRGPLWVWECAPLFCGVGLGMIVAGVFMSLYYNMFAAYSLVYFARCFSSIFPWIFCDHNYCNEENVCTPYSWYVSENASDSSKDYFYNVLLNSQRRYPSEVWTLGSFKWWLFLTLMFSWFVVYAATLRSARSIGKFAIATVIFSYFAIVSLLIAAFQMTHRNYKKQDQSTSIFNLHMWYAAIVQVLLELGLCFGIPITYGSYCRFRNPVHIDSVILCVLNYFNSLICCFLFFAAFRKSLCIDSSFRWSFPDDTMAVVYIIYSEAVSLMPGKYYWCVLFFFMLFCVLIGTQIALTETLMTVIYDHFHNLTKWRWLYNLCICLLFFIFGVMFCFSNGFHTAVVLYYFPSFITSVITTLAFVIGMVCVYGLYQYFEDMKVMLEKNMKFLSKFLIYLSVILLVVACIILIFDFGNLNLITGVVYYESQIILACVVSVVILCPIVICAVLWMLYCEMDRNTMCQSSNSWKSSQLERIEGTGQYFTEYNSSFTWEWNYYGANVELKGGNK